MSRWRTSVMPYNALLPAVQAWKPVCRRLSDKAKDLKVRSCVQYHIVTDKSVV